MNKLDEIEHQYNQRYGISIMYTEEILDEICYFYIVEVMYNA